MVIGGASVYKQFLPRANKMYLTVIDHIFDGDTFFPDISDEWIETEREFHSKDSENPYDYAFVTLEKKGS